ncbi:MAG: hypothetical protein ACXWGT_07080 [Usitatibacter sp.]
MLRIARLSLVLAAGLILGLPASAVYVDPNGRGQALIYPYYTAQSADGNPYNTFVSVANHTANSKVIRVRFREGRNGREVGTFNLYLAGGDVWAAAVIPTEFGARLVTVDQSCTNGPLVSEGGTKPVRHLDFTNANYTGSRNDNLGAGQDRTREGYVEMIEMAGLGGASDGAVRPGADPTFPANCAAVQGASPAIETIVPSGGLSGTLTVINVAKGMDFTVNAVALAQLTTQPFYRNFDDPYPDFNSSEVTAVTTFVAQGKTYRATLQTGLDAVAAALFAKSIANEVILDQATRSGTDWIVTFPMSRFQPYAQPTPPTSFPAGSTQGMPYSVLWTPRDGPSFSIVTECGFTCPGNTFEGASRLPWAATVVSFDRGSAFSSGATTSKVLGSSNAIRLALPTTSENGSGDLGFNSALRVTYGGSSIRLVDGVTSAEGATVPGVPVVGFMVRTFENGLLNCGSSACQGNYGGSFPHTAVSAFER